MQYIHTHTHTTDIYPKNVLHCFPKSKLLLPFLTTQASNHNHYQSHDVIMYMNMPN